MEKMLGYIHEGMIALDIKNIYIELIFILMK